MQIGCNSVKLNWRQAAFYADNLIQQSRWSRTIYTYQKAAMLSMLEDSMTPEEKRQVEQCMRYVNKQKKSLLIVKFFLLYMFLLLHKFISNLCSDAPQWKQRIAGKSLPMEKFAVKKTERFFAQEKHLILPALELMYVWNLFKVVGKKWKLMEELYKLIEKSEKQLMATKGYN